MIIHGFMPTTQGPLHVVPKDGWTTMNWIRVANQSGAGREFTIYLRAGDSPDAIAITPVNTVLDIGDAYDDVPAMSLEPVMIIEGVASGDNVGYTLNVS